VKNLFKKEKKSVSIHNYYLLRDTYDHWMENGMMCNVALEGYFRQPK